MTVDRYRPWWIAEWRTASFRSLDDPCKVLASYLRTGPQTNRCGLFVFSQGLAAEDLEWPQERLVERFAKVVETLNHRFDSTARVLFIPDWFRVNRPANPNVFKSWLDDIRELPATPLLAAFCDNTKWLPTNLARLLPNVYGNVPANVSANVSPNLSTQEQEQEPPPPTPSSAGDSQSEWEVVEKILIETGVGTTDSLIRDLQLHGCSPELAMATVAYWRRAAPAWGEGALVQRLRTLRADQDPTAPQLWAPRKQAVVRAEASSEALAAQEHRHREGVEARAKRADQVDARQRLLERHGESFRALPEDDQRAVFVTVLNGEGEYEFGRFRRSKFIPDDILQYLEKSR